MTVAELREKLKNFPQDAVVYVEDDETLYEPHVSIDCYNEVTISKPF